MERDILEWQPFESSADDALLRPSGDEDARFVAILTTAGARESGWAAGATVDLARRWAQRRGRLLLADLDLREPRLHLELGVENGEGMSDAFLFGASIQRIAVPVDRGFLFAPAGIVVADPGDVLTADRWGAVLDGFSRAGATLVVHLPAETEGVGELLERATDVVLLTRPGEESGVALGAWAERVRAVLGPDGRAGTSGAPRDDEVGGFAGAAAVEEPVTAPPAEGAGWAEDAGTPDETGGADAAPTAEDLADDDFEHVGRPASHRSSGRLDPVAIEAGSGDQAARRGKGPPTTRRAVDRAAAETGGRRRTSVLLLVLLLVVLAVVVAGYVGVIDVPYLTAARAGGGEAEPVVVAGAPRPAPPLAYSLGLGSFQDAAVAELQAEGLSERRPDLLFVVTPVEVEGEVFHRLLAGPAVDSAAALSLRASLASTLTREDPESWLVRATPLAFDLGAFDSREGADARAGELRETGIPAYTLARGAGGGGFHVWAGAFADEAEAAHLKTLLEARELGDAPLRQRTGRIPPPTV